MDALFMTLLFYAAKCSQHRQVGPAIQLTEWNAQVARYKGEVDQLGRDPDQPAV